MLAGLVGSTDNPAKMEDAAIIDFLRRIPDARASFDRVFPTMSVDEQARLQILSDISPPQKDVRDAEDAFQNGWNRRGIRPRGPAARLGAH